MVNAWTIEPAEAHDLEATVHLLAAAGLPTEGVPTQFPQAFLRVRDGAEIVAVGAIERYGQFGLLRSVAVHSEFRHRGVGRRLVQQLVAEASAAGLARVFLLTEGARDFFLRLGFTPTSRDQAPLDVQRSPQFASICSSAAHCLAWSM